MKSTWPVDPRLTKLPRGISMTTSTRGGTPDDTSAFSHERRGAAAAPVARALAAAGVCYRLRILDGETPMPMYMDIHDVPGVTPEDVAKAHLEDVRIQAKHGVEYVKYWLNQKQGKIYCLCTAPSAKAADAEHREAHGLAAARSLKVTPDIADAFMGAAESDNAGAALLPGNAGRDPGTRSVLFTDIVGSTNMTQRLGDEIALAMLKVHDRIVRAALGQTSGREVKHTGDGIMAVFVSAAAAVRCAINVHQSLAQHRSAHPDQPLKVRVGVAAGEPIEHH